MGGRPRTILWGNFLNLFGAARTRAVVVFTLAVLLCLSLTAGGCRKAGEAKRDKSSTVTSSLARPDGSSLPTASSTPARKLSSTSSGKSPKNAARPTEPAPGFITDTPRPTKTIASGAKLEQLQVPPVRTVSGVRLPAGAKEAIYEVVFEPYGWASDSAAGKRLLIKIISAKPQGDANGIADLTGANAIANVTPERVGGFGQGGRFGGTIRVSMGPADRTQLSIVTARRTR